jgi:hypothetical protein
MTTMTLPKPASGTATKATDTQHAILSVAVLIWIAEGRCCCGDCWPYIERGALRDGRAPSTTLLAMAKRGYVNLIKRGPRIEGAYVTDLGRRKLAELDAAAARQEEINKAVRGW